MMYQVLKCILLYCMQIVWTLIIGTYFNSLIKEGAVNGTEAGVFTKVGMGGFLASFFFFFVIHFTL